jgi:hypothetical protein
MAADPLRSTALGRGQGVESARGIYQFKGDAHNAALPLWFGITFTSHSGGNGTARDGWAFEVYESDIGNLWFASNRDPAM